ncbi:MAG: radical SAM protein [Lachnospiraceae bacterium]|jgi:MoaA/NifB/PqqE/SkfB family radical SAM enzyme
MASTVQNLKHSAERAAVGAMLDGLLNHLNKVDDRIPTYLKIVDLAQKFIGNDENKAKFESVRKKISDPNYRWTKFLDRVIQETNPHVAKMTLLNLGYEAFLRGTKMIRANREKYGCNIPWLILFDPTDACNMHCVGCWSGTYGHKASLTYDEMDSIITQGKELGVYLYMLTGGEPLVRKKDILKLAEKHNDVEIAIYTNSTLIDDEFCKEVQRVGNIVFQLSIEGSPDTNDARRGKGHYAAVMNAMDLMQKYGLLFGTSICYTRQNIEAVTDEKFLRFISEKGARYGFFFHYMPVGNNAVPELMPTVEQRRQIIKTLRHIRSDECDIGFFPMDFQNDGGYVGGCIAGGRNYFHINAHGDAEPCVFIHYSDSNIREKTILQILQSPLFMEYHEGQPFNRNHLRPCPMLENPDLLRKMVHDTGAHGTNAESEESVEHLTAKCDEYAKEWAPVADEIWSHEVHKKPSYENYTKEKREHPELAAFETEADLTGAGAGSSSAAK